MAIQKSIQTNKGIPAEYWKIIRTDINWKDRTSEVALYGYPNKQARLDGYEPIDTRVFNWSDFPFTFDGNNVAQAYEKIVESRPIVITPAKEAVLDEDGNVVEEAVEEVTEETNEFAGSIDC